MFQVIIFAYVWQEDVYKHITIVHSHPLGIFETHDVRRFFLQSLACKVADGFCDGFYL